MENLFGQEYKNGFVVNKENPQFISLSTNIKLGTKIDKAQIDYENQFNKLFNINKDYGTVSYLPQSQFIKVKEANTLLEQAEPKIKHKEITEYENLRRLNLQIQNRLNERAVNQIDTAFAPQGLTNNQVLALSSTKPKLQKEIDAIEEYARTHFLTPEQVKKLKDELIKKNYDEWVRTVENVRAQQTGAPTINPINNTADAPEPEPATQSDREILNLLLEAIRGQNNGTTAPPAEAPTQTATARAGEPAQAPAPAPTPEEPKAGAEASKIRRRIPRSRNPLIVERKPKVTVNEGDRPIQAPERPQRLNAQDVIDDYNQYRDDYVNQKPIVNLSQIPTDANINDMVNTYFTNYFLREFRGTSMINKGTANKFLSFFQPLTPQGRTELNKIFFIGRLERKDYIERLFQALNDIYKKTNPAGQDFIQVITENVNGKDYIVMPTSPLQRDQFLNTFAKFSHKCRTLLVANAPEIYMKEKTSGVLEFATQEQLNLFRQSVENGIITGKNIFDFSRVGTPQKEMKDRLDYVF